MKFIFKEKSLKFRKKTGQFFNEAVFGVFVGIAFNLFVNKLEINATLSQIKSKSKSNPPTFV